MINTDRKWPTYTAYIITTSLRGNKYVICPTHNIVRTHRYWSKCSEFYLYLNLHRLSNVIIDLTKKHFQLKWKSSIMEWKLFSLVNWIVIEMLIHANGISMDHFIEVNPFWNKGKLCILNVDCILDIYFSVFMSSLESSIFLHFITSVFL